MTAPCPGWTDLPTENIVADLYHTVLDVGVLGRCTYAHLLFGNCTFKDMGENEGILFRFGGNLAQYFLKRLFLILVDCPRVLSRKEVDSGLRTAGRSTQGQGDTIRTGVRGNPTRQGQEMAKRPGERRNPTCYLSFSNSYT